MCQLAPACTVCLCVSVEERIVYFGFDVDLVTFEGIISVSYPVTMQGIKGNAYILWENPGRIF